MACPSGAELVQLQDAVLALLSDGFRRNRFPGLPLVGELRPEDWPAEVVVSQETFSRLADLLGEQIGPVGLWDRLRAVADTGGK